MNLPNKLTVFRIIIVPIIVFFLLYQNIKNHYVYALLLFMIASYTDHLDGKIARKSGIITNFGKFADPLADKILIISCLVCFLSLGLIDIVSVLIVISREFIVTSVRLIAAEHGTVISANNWGKIKTVSQISSIISVIALQAIGEVLIQLNFSNVDIYLNISNTIGVFLIWVSVVLTVVSGIIYIYNNRDLIRDFG